jgi:hypothetical protein
MVISRSLGVLLAMVFGSVTPALAQEPTKTDKREPHVVSYEVRDLLAKPETVNLVPFGGQALLPWNAFQRRHHARNLQPSEQALRLVQSLFAVVDGLAGSNLPFEQANIQVVNGTRLVIRANADQHAEIAALLAAFRRLGDLAVVLSSKLYEVDDAFYKKLKNAKPVDWEEEERLYLEGKFKREPLFDTLAKQRPLQLGDEVKLDSGFSATLLARQHAVTFSPNRDQIIQGQKSRQTLLEGVVFSAGISVTSDRRAVRMQLTEKATEIRQVRKVKVMFTPDSKEVDVDVPFTNETAHRREFEIPDGGTMLVPVHYRPKSLQDTNRWLVLSITPRIWIEEEERHIRVGNLEAISPLIVADVLKNPRLKANRDLIGTAGDKRFALVDSAAWTWPKEFKADVAGFERAPTQRAGQRLLGLRVDQFQQAAKESEPSTLTVTLINAGGSANGAVVGSCTLRYSARSSEKGSTVELLDD